MPDQGANAVQGERVSDAAQPATITRSSMAIAAVAMEPISSTKLAAFSKHSFHVYLSEWPFRFCWWLILVIHVAIGGFAISAAMLNRFLQQESVSPLTASLQVQVETLELTAGSFVVVAVGHTIAIATMIWKSVQARRLTFHSRVATEPTMNTGKSSSFLACCSSQIASHFRVAAVRIGVVGTWQKYFGTNGYFRLSGEFIEVAFTIREGIEIALQTYQAYNLSLSVARVWINQLAVGVIILNCMSTPLGHVVFPKNASLRRLVNLAMDGVLDFCCSVVIPIAIVLPYTKTIDDTNNISLEFLMNDVWYVNAVSEIRQALVTSIPDYLSTMIPQLSLLGCLVTLKSGLHRRSTTDVQVWPINQDCCPAHELKKEKRAEQQVTERLGQSDLKQVLPMTESKQLINKPQQQTRRIRMLICAIFTLWGLAVLGLHLQANHQTVTGCHLYVNAWYATGFACSVMTLNCHMHQIQGSTNKTQAILAQLERSTLRILVFSHCSALHIPPVTMEFSRLAGLEVFNCSLADWPMEAAIHQNAHAEIGYTFLILTNWTTFPAGLLHNELPSKLTHMVIVGSNMTELPATIGDVWGEKDWITIAVEQIPLLHHVPPSFCKISVLQLSFAMTGIETVPEMCFPGALLVTLAGTPLQALPDSVAFDPASLWWFSAEHTQITTLPLWFSAAWMTTEAPSTIVAMYGSPVCQFDLLLNSTDYCMTDYDTVTGSYPWEYMLPQRQYVDVVAT